MIQTIRADFYRLFHSKGFWITEFVLLANILLGVLYKVTSKFGTSISTDSQDVAQQVEIRTVFEKANPDDLFLQYFEWVKTLIPFWRQAVTRIAELNGICVFLQVLLKNGKLSLAFSILQNRKPVRARRPRRGRIALGDGVELDDGGAVGGDCRGGGRLIGHNGVLPAPRSGGARPPYQRTPAMSIRCMLCRCSTARSSASSTTARSTATSCGGGSPNSTAPAPACPRAPSTPPWPAWKGPA